MVRIQPNEQTDEAVKEYGQYIASQTLATTVSIDPAITADGAQSVEMDDNLTLLVAVQKV